MIAADGQRPFPESGEKLSGMTFEETRQAYERRSRDYIAMFPSISATDPEDRDLIQAWATAQTGPILDVGCGPGHWTGWLHGQGLDIEGIDPVPAFIDQARLNHPEVRFRVGRAEALGVEASSLAGILAWYSVIHTDPELLDTFRVDAAPLSGRLQFRVSGAADFDEPSYAFEVSVDDLFVGAEGIGSVSGRAVIANDVMTIERLVASSSRLQVLGTGSIAFDDAYTSDIRLRFQETALDPYLKFVMADDVSPYAAPARADSLEDLPRAFLDVGGNDIFRDEDLAYATRLWRAGVPTEVHVYPGGPHGYESLAAATDLAQRTLLARYGFLRSV